MKTDTEQVIDAVVIEKRTASGPARPLARRSKRGATPAPRRIRLRTLDDIAVEMAKCYKQARSGEIDSGDLSRYVYALSQLGKIVEVALLEARITALEGVVEAPRLAGD
jgi:hypothetical protein